MFSLLDNTTFSVSCMILSHCCLRLSVYALWNSLAFVAVFFVLSQFFIWLRESCSLACIAVMSWRGGTLLSACAFEAIPFAAVLLHVGRPFSNWALLTLSRAWLINWTMPGGRGFQPYLWWILPAMDWMKVGSRRPRFALDDRSALVLR